jgi:hypothetical protein
VSNSLTGITENYTVFYKGEHRKIWVDEDELYVTDPDTGWPVNIDTILDIRYDN